MVVFWIFLSFFLLSLGLGIFVAVHRRTLKALWFEPVLRQPVLIIESDDWGPAPVNDVQSLKYLMRLLSRHKDNEGKQAIMTIGVVLSIPDGARISATGLQQYYRQTLAEERYEPLRKTLINGLQQGVFSLQLHGMEHFWPENVMAAARDNELVRIWLTSEMPKSEDLPDALQSRWCDASVLPSRELDADIVRQAASEEAVAFSQIFGQIPVVAVPPTFIWNDAVEEGWAKAGVRVVISPGRRLYARDSNGRPVGPLPNQAGSMHLNGMRSRFGLTYLIRNGWFEPLRGHTAEKAIDNFACQVLLGRPMLFETHRSNFVGDGPSIERALGELDSLLSEALKRFPDLRFCASEQLVKHLNMSDIQWVECGFRQRINVFLRRVLAHPPLHRLAIITGTFLVARVGLLLSTRCKRWQTT